MPRISPLIATELILLLSTTMIVAAAPDQIFHHGKVLTVNEKFEVAEAFAVTGDRLTEIGANADVIAKAGPQTVMVDLRGSTVIPGLIDSHVHATAAAIYEFDHPVPEMETVEEVLEYVKSRAAVVPKGEWIFVSQIFVTRLKQPRFPTRQELDQAAPEHPVCFRTGPDAAFNSLALKLNNVDRETQVPEGKAAKIERDASTGEPTGVIRSYGGWIKTGNANRQPNADERREALAKLLTDYNSLGITSIAERSASEDTITLYQSLRDHDQLTCRVFLNWSIDPNASMEEIEKRVRQGAEHPAHQYDPWIWLRGVKIFLDGGMLTGSAYMRQPWGLSRIYSIDDPNYRGLLYVQPERLYQVAKLCLTNELQFTAHAVGDGAVHALIDAYEQVNETFPVQAARPCITHCNFMSAEAIEKMRKLGIVADLQPAWLWLDGATLERQFGEARLAYFQPYRSLQSAGVIVGGGSDHMLKVGGLRSVNPYDPFLGLWIILKRQPRSSDHVLHSEQCVDREQALRIYTINNAYITLDEKNRGSLEPGKLADFVILDRDYLTCPLDEVREIRPQETYVGGRKVWRRGGFGL